MEEQNNKALTQMQKLDAALDEYEVQIGLNKYLEEIKDKDIEYYLSITREQAEKLDLESCAYAALILGKFAFHLQRSYNRELARVNWASSVLKKVVSGRETQYTGSWDSQFQQAIQGDDYTKKILRLKQYAQQRADRINFLSSSVSNMSKLFMNLQKAKGMKYE